LKWFQQQKAPPKDEAFNLFENDHAVNERAEADWWDKSGSDIAHALPATVSRKPGKTFAPARNKTAFS
jgi:hypothetical protein